MLPLKKYLFLFLARNGEPNSKHFQTISTSMTLNIGMASMYCVVKSVVMNFSENIQNIINVGNTAKQKIIFACCHLESPSIPFFWLSFTMSGKMTSETDDLII